MQEANELHEPSEGPIRKTHPLSHIFVLWLMWNLFMKHKKEEAQGTNVNIFIVRLVHLETIPRQALGRDIIWSVGICTKDY